MGRPRFEPTPEQRTMVKQLCAFGLTQPQICQFIRDKRGVPISQDTLADRFRRELDEGLPEANAQVARSLFRLAIDGNLGAMIFWLKTRARWHETPQDIRVFTADGQPAKAGVLMVPAPMTPQEWEAQTTLFAARQQNEVVDVEPVQQSIASR